jgi:hypothetical protein
MKKDNQTNTLLLSDVYFPDTKLPEREYDNEPESIEVGVIIENEHFKAYYNHDDKCWWVDYGGMSVGHRKLDDYDVQGWYYLTTPTL